MTISNRGFGVLGLPGGQLGDFPRFLGDQAGLPISAKSVGSFVEPAVGSIAVSFFAREMVDRQPLSGAGCHHARSHQHRRAARVFEDQHPDDYGTLSHHFTAAGEREAAIRYNLLVAQRASSLYASDSAIQKFHAALQLLGMTKEQPGQRRQVLEQFGAG